MTPEQITDLIRQLAVVEYERNLILDDIAAKDAEIAELRKDRNAVYVEDFGIFAAKQVRILIDTKSELKDRIAELERENVELNMAWKFEHGASEGLVRKCDRLSAALKLARER